MAFNGVPRFLGTNLIDWARQSTLVTNSILNGKTNNTGTFTLAANTVSSSIVLAEGRLGQDTAIFYTPTTASAATEFGAGSIFVSSRDVANASFSLTHASTADADKIFNFVLIG